MRRFGHPSRSLWCNQEYAFALMTGTGAILALCVLAVFVIASG
jgi:hypothetical protein